MVVVVVVGGGGGGGGSRRVGVAPVCELHIRLVKRRERITYSTKKLNNLITG